MVVFLYTNDKCEYQAKYCIESFVNKLSKDDKIVYFTIGFNSSLEYDKLYKVTVPYKDYPTFHYYKAELSLLVMDLFPEEQHFCFTDTDIVFSKRVNFEKLKHNLSYPLASLGPHEYPFTYDTLKENSKYTDLNIENFKSVIQLDNGNIGTWAGDIIIYNEVPCMDYFNVKGRTMQYVWSCFYSFNRNCKDFFEEYTSMCKNTYLLSRRYWMFPFHDETSFNICLWKRKADKNLGHAFVNTHFAESVKQIEEKNDIVDVHTGNNIDERGANWEYIHDSSNVILYHGIKEENSLKEALKYVVNG